jgi:hypothetical protein
MTECKFVVAYILSFVSDGVIIIYLFIFNCNWIDARWQQYSTHLRTNNTQNTENGTYVF